MAVIRPREHETRYQLTIIYDTFSEYDNQWFEDCYRPGTFKTLERCYELLKNCPYEKKHPEMKRKEWYIEEVETKIIMSSEVLERVAKMKLHD